MNHQHSQACFGRQGDLMIGPLCGFAETSGELQYISLESLDVRLNKITGDVSDAALHLEAELNAATTQDAIRAVERRAEALSLLLQHVQSAAWEKANQLR